MTHNTLIGVLGGSFNPVHAGHMMLAQYMAEFAGLDRVWLMLSPQNPLKTGTQESDAHRMEMLRIACSGTPRISPCDIELSMPRPSYTAATLARLTQQHPTCRFSLIIGSDNWLTFHRWKDHQYILDNFPLTIYPRPGYPIDTNTLPPSAKYCHDAPVCDLSSTFLRKALSQGHCMDRFLPAGVYEYITEHKLYI